MKKLILFFALIFLCAPAWAATTPAETVKQVESYLNSLKTLKADFTQTAADGREATGTFYLRRPGRLRFEYDAPVKDFIVADGLFIYFYDSELKEQSHTLIRNSLADFFLRKDLDLSGDIRVEDVTREKNRLSLIVTKAEEPDAGKLILKFEAEPLRLTGWQVIDAQGLTTNIALSDIKTGLSLDRNLFFFTDPETGKTIYNN